MLGTLVGQPGYAASLNLHSGPHAGHASAHSVNTIDRYAALLANAHAAENAALVFFAAGAQVKLANFGERRRD
jgi:hypothetical protein